MDPRRKQGDAAEQRALEYFQKLGCTLIARNVRFRIGEIDLIVRKDQTLIFIEVRSRSDSSQQYEIQALMPEYKIQRFQRLVETYLKWNDETANEIQMLFYLEIRDKMEILEVPIKTTQNY